MVSGAVRPFTSGAYISSAIVPGTRNVPAVVARPRSADAGRGILERQPARVAPCTEAVAALGLCAPEAIQRRD